MESNKYSSGSSLQHTQKNKSIESVNQFFVEQQPFSAFFFVRMTMLFMIWAFVRKQFVIIIDRVLLNSCSETHTVSY